MKKVLGICYAYDVQDAYQDILDIGFTWTRMGICFPWKDKMYGELGESAAYLNISGTTSISDPGRGRRWRAGMMSLTLFMNGINCLCWPTNGDTPRAGRRKVRARTLRGRAPGHTGLLLKSADTQMVSEEMSGANLRPGLLRGK